MQKKCDCACSCKEEETSASLSPRKLTFSRQDYWKALLNWLFLFRRADSVEPGLYFMGESYDKKAPLVISCNSLLTLILLYRRLRSTSVRLLVIDTKGINVWCSSGKGQFSSEEIVQKLSTYDRGLLSDSDQIEIILPKLSFSGVRLSVLRKNKIRPVIGPVYLKDLKDYLEHPPYKDCVSDDVTFDLADRLYVTGPSVVQFLKFIIYMAMALAVQSLIFHTGFHWEILLMAAAISFLYPLLFPWIPGKKFAVKGMFLAGLFSTGTLVLFLLNFLSIQLVLFYTTFFFATGIFFGLYFTGNSAVSNYSEVKKEIIRFLPVSAVLYLAALILNVFTRSLT